MPGYRQCEPEISGLLYRSKNIALMEPSNPSSSTFVWLCHYPKSSPLLQKVLHTVATLPNFAITPNTQCFSINPCFHIFHLPFTGLHPMASGGIRRTTFIKGPGQRKRNGEPTPSNTFYNYTFTGSYIYVSRNLTCFGLSI